MRGKTRCPYCNKQVIVEVPDGAVGLQKTKCPNCGMNIVVDVREKEEKREESFVIHPLVKKEKTAKPMIAGILLVMVFVMGVLAGSFILLSQESILRGYGEYKAKVFNEEGKPLQGVKAYLNDKMVVSDEEGNIYFSNVTAGKHTLWLHKEGYKSMKIKVLVLPWKNFLTDKFRMKEGNGTIEDESFLYTAFQFLPYLAFGIIIVSIPALIGGIFCFLRKQALVAIICSIFGIFSIGPFFIGSILSIIALALIVLSREEFS
ncbi:MAG: hypothetical protein J7L80_04845 [Thermoplasmata archaeon]|nr:hypothetical protein [Thermoplasmata archaeon]